MIVFFAIFSGGRGALGGLREHGEASLRSLKCGTAAGPVPDDSFKDQRMLGFDDPRRQPVVQLGWSTNERRSQLDLGGLA